MDSETTEGLTITLDLTEAKFLLTILKASSEILTTIMSLQQSMPGLSAPITTDTIVNIAALTEKVRDQNEPAVRRQSWLLICRWPKHQPITAQFTAANCRATEVIILDVPAKYRGDRSSPVGWRRTAATRVSTRRKVDLIRAPTSMAKTCMRIVCQRLLCAGCSLYYGLAGSIRHSFAGTHWGGVNL
jgi:hypothetical protein